MRPLVRDLLCDALLSAGLTDPLRTPRDLLTIVTFHRVLPEEACREYPLRQIAVTEGELEWLVEFFQRHYVCGNLASVHDRHLRAERSDRALLGLTFDDGQLDNYVHAVPVLRRAGVTATFFVPVAAIDDGAPLWHDRFARASRALLERAGPRGRALLRDLTGARADGDAALANAALQAAKRRPVAEREEIVTRIEAEVGAPPRPSWDGFMSWDQLRALAAAGHEIGSHSMSHALLTVVDDEQLRREVEGSRTRIEREVGAACDSFCYPNGDLDARVLRAVRRAGYRRAVTTRWGLNPRTADPMRLVRCDMQGPHARSRGGALSASRVAFRMSRFFPGPRT